MWFPWFTWRRPRPADGGGWSTRSRPTGGWSTGSRRRGEAFVADEIEAFLAGRLVDHLAARSAPVPAWAALNRLAHANRAELRALADGGGCPLLAVVPWATTERTIAGSLLARAPTAEALGRIQRCALVPLELRLVERSRAAGLTAEQVLEAGAEALDTFRSDR